MCWIPHITVAAIVEQEQKFLFVEERVNGHIVINQPAGHVEDGESLQQAIIRETREESGWRIEPHALVAVHRWVSPKNETFFRFTFAAHALDYNPEQTLDDGIIRPLWLNRDELLQHAELLRSPMVIDGVERYLCGERYPLHLLVDL